MYNDPDGNFVLLHKEKITKCEFEVDLTDTADKLASMQTLIIEVSGGVVQEVYSNAENLHVIKIDWDAGESPGDAYCGGPSFVQPMSALPIETRAAIAALTK